MGRKKKRHDNDDSDLSDTDSGSEVSEKTRQTVLPVATQKRQQALPGATVKPRKHPPWYSARILEEERPDLAGADGRINLEREEAALMDMFIRGKSDLQTGDLIITDDNLDEEDRKFNRYEVQLKYNEGRYTALYLISRQVCANNETVEKNTLFAMKTSIRPYSVNITLRMKRELRILNELKKNKCPYSPIVLDSGRVADLPFIVMNLLDRNLEKLREQTASLKPATVYYVAHEALAAIAFLHSMKYIHRDVKLTNICIGAGPLMTRIYLIDYGDTVKQGKKIRYGTPDGYTLPYWSLDAHKRGIAREKGDLESWFYVLIDLLAPGALPWSKMHNEKTMEAEKTCFWEGKRQMPDSPYVFALFDIIRRLTNNFNYQLARQMLREAIDYHQKGPLVLEWAPNLRVPLSPLTGRRVVGSNLNTDKTSRTSRSVDQTMRSLADDEQPRDGYSRYKQAQMMHQQQKYGRTQATVETRTRTNETSVEAASAAIPSPVQKTSEAFEMDEKRKAKVALIAGRVPSATAQQRVKPSPRKPVQPMPPRQQLPRQPQQQQARRRASQKTRPQQQQQQQRQQQQRLQQQRLQQQRLQQQRLQQQRAQQQRRQKQARQRQREQSDDDD
ncbi:hypothetical protein V3C99_010008 [Haemonchus contortus]